MPAAEDALNHGSHTMADLPLRSLTEQFRVEELSGKTYAHG